MKQERCISYLKPFTKRLIIGPIFKFIEAVFELIVPILMALIIDEGIKKRGGDLKYIYSVGSFSADTFQLCASGDRQAYRNN